MIMNRRKIILISIITILILITIVVITYLRSSVTHRTYAKVNRLGYYLDKMNILLNKSIGLRMSKLVAAFYAENKIGIPMLTYVRAVLRDVTYIRRVSNRNVTMTYVRAGGLVYRLVIIRGEGKNVVNDTQVLECRNISITSTRYDYKMSKVCIIGTIVFEEFRNGNKMINKTIRADQCIIMHISNKLPENEEARRVMMTIITARAIAEIYLPYLLRNLKPLKEEYVNNQKCIEYLFTGTLNLSKAITSEKIQNYIEKITHIEKTSIYLTEIAKALIRNRQEIASIKYRICILENGIPITQSITIQNKEKTIKVTTNYTITNIEITNNTTIPKIEAPTRPIQDIAIIRTIDITLILTQAIKQAVPQALLYYIATSTIMR